jgi:ubiquinone/menaquinone biosynthesis C-methylase UbiE
LETTVKLPPGIREALQTIRIEGRSTDRRVLCPFCHDWVPRSLPPHLRAEHPEVWEEWRQEFLTLATSGYSVRQIMNTFNRLFTWSVIETDLKKLAEELGRPLPVPEAPVVRRWEPEGEPDTDTTVWSFPQRGSWAVHSPEYRGNWSPYVPRAIIKRYSRSGQTVCDPFAGGGTTLIECWLLGRNGVGFDASPHAVAFAAQRVKEMGQAAKQTLFPLPEVEISIRNADARSIPLADNSVDLICTHPPYGPAIRYTAKVTEDLSRLPVQKFIQEIPNLAKEFHRVLKSNKVCALLIGDFKEKRKLVPLGWYFFKEFSSLFNPVDIIIKEQHQDSSTEFYYTDLKRKRLLRIRHEYLFIFRKER